MEQLQTHHLVAKAPIPPMLQVPSKIVLAKILIVPEVLRKTALKHQILHQEQIHPVQQPEQRIGEETCQQPRQLNQRLKMQIQMPTVQLDIM